MKINANLPKIDFNRIFGEFSLSNMSKTISEVPGNSVKQISGNLGEIQTAINKNPSALHESATYSSGFGEFAAASGIIYLRDIMYPERKSDKEPFKGLQMSIAEI